MGEMSTWKYPQGFHRERRRKYPPRKFSFIFPSFPQGNHEEFSAGMIPWNSPINPRVKSGGRGWLARWDFGVLLGLNSLLRGLYIFSIQTSRFNENPGM